MRSTDPHPAHEAQPLEHAPPPARVPRGAGPLSHSPRDRMRRTAKTDRTASTANTNTVPGVNTNTAMRFSFSHMRSQRGAYLFALPHCRIPESRAQAIRVNVIQLSYALQSRMHVSRSCSEERAGRRAAVRKRPGGQAGGRTSHNGRWTGRAADTTGGQAVRWAANRRRSGVADGQAVADGRWTGRTADTTGAGQAVRRAADTTGAGHDGRSGGQRIATRSGARAFREALPFRLSHDWRNGDWRNWRIVKFPLDEMQMSGCRPYVGSKVKELQEQQYTYI